MEREPSSADSRVDLAPLIEWYNRQCDGYWENRHGINLATLDNPGWILKVDLIDTDLQGRTMPELREGLYLESDHPDPDSPTWIHCSIRENQFVAASDPSQLARLFALFEAFRAAQTP